MFHFRINEPSGIGMVHVRIDHLRNNARTPINVFKDETWVVPLSDLGSSIGLMNASSSQLHVMINGYTYRSAVSTMIVTVFIAPSPFMNHRVRMDKRY